MTRYLKISPRGFSNETVIRYGSAEAIKIAASIINDDVNAWAEIIPASHSDVRRAKREHAKNLQWMSKDRADECSGITRLHEADVVRHRPTMLPDNGPRYLGGPKLPKGYDEPAV